MLIHVSMVLWSVHLGVVTRSFVNKQKLSVCCTAPLAMNTARHVARQTVNTTIQDIADSSTMSLSTQNKLNRDMTYE